MFPSDESAFRSLYFQFPMQFPDASLHIPLSIPIKLYSNDGGGMGERIELRTPPWIPRFRSRGRCARASSNMANSRISCPPLISRKNKIIHNCKTNRSVSCVIYFAILAECDTSQEKWSEVKISGAVPSWYSPRAQNHLRPYHSLIIYIIIITASVIYRIVQ